jgi:phosphoribosylformimino-5-aminoimidazole carboxamide ribotide isomerase
VNFTVIPAVDLKGGRCVRLTQGRAEALRVYSEDPVDMARHWEAEGARYLHVVDLDGAFQGRPVHTALVARMAAAVRIPLEVGGGLRTDDDLRRVLECGVDRAIVGTRAFADTEDLGRLAAVFGRRLAVGIDSRDGWVQVKGWVETTRRRATDLARDADRLGVATLICTDTATDGMLSGVSLDAVQMFCEAVECRVIASGGVSSAEDIKALKALRAPNLEGAVVGKALYEGKVRLKALLAVA